MPLTVDALHDDIAQRCFGLPEGSEGPPRIGAEVEFLPVLGEGGAVVPLFGAKGLIAVLARRATRFDWQLQGSIEETPRFTTPAGGIVSFEPGGQIEYSTRAHESASALLRDLEQFATELEEIATGSGIVLLTDGIDPINPVANAPLQLTTARYANMARYFAGVGPSGARMMRQTTAVQLNLELGSDPLGRWRLLNALAPALIALFANSRVYAGEDSGFASYRAQVWRETDPSRTGVFDGDAAVERYTRFALAAPAILPPFSDVGFRPFASWLEDASEQDWLAHLSTLFPEIRPKGYFEVRSIDGQAPSNYVAPIALLCGLVYDAEASYAAAALLPKPDEALLIEAGRYGAESPQLQPLLPDLVAIALAGCARLPAAFLQSADLEQAGEQLALRCNPSTSSAGDDVARIRTRHSRSYIG